MTKKSNQTIFAFLLAAALSFGSYFWLDQKVAFWIHTWHVPSLQKIGWLLSQLQAPFFLLYLWFGLLILERIFLCKRDLFFLLLSLCFTTLICMFITGNVKMILGRARPFLLIEKGIWGFFPFTTKDSFLSMPSSHASVIFATLYMLWKQKKLSLGWFLGILSITFFRILQLQHYVSDIFSGFFVGFLAVKTTLYLYKLLINKEIIKKMRKKIDK